MEYQIIRLIDKPEMKEQMAKWFHEKWKVPLQAYLESMDECLTGKHRIPQWYVARAHCKARRDNSRMVD